MGYDAVLAIAVPLEKCGLGLDNGVSIGIENYGGVASARILVDKHVVGTVGDIVVIDESIVFEE